MGQSLSRSLAPAGRLWKGEPSAPGQEGVRHEACKGESRGT